jgi:hypothetical protein
MPPNSWEKLAEVLRAVEPDLQRRIVYLQVNPPDPLTQPVSSALARAYLSRLEIYVRAIRGGAKGLSDHYRDYPTLLQELQEMEAWIVRKKVAGEKTELTIADEDAIGDWLVSTGRSYSQAKQMLRRMQQFLTGRGAPNKRPETLRMLDAKVSQALSYKRLASNMCDCGLAQHTEQLRGADTKENQGIRKIPHQVQDQRPASQRAVTTIRKRLF